MNESDGRDKRGRRRKETEGGGMTLVSSTVLLKQLSGREVTHMMSGIPYRALSPIRSHHQMGKANKFLY